MSTLQAWISANLLALIGGYYALCFLLSAGFHLAGREMPRALKVFVSFGADVPRFIEGVTDIARFAGIPVPLALLRLGAKQSVEKAASPAGATVEQTTTTLTVATSNPPDPPKAAA